MAEDKIQKVLTIEVEYSQALDGIAKYRTELDRAKGEAKLLTDALKNHAKQLNEGKITEEQYAKAVLETQKRLAANKQEQMQLSDAIRTSEKVVRNQIMQQNEAQDSLKSMRAQLSNLVKEYDELSREQRENDEVGGKLQRRIADLTNEIKDAEEATERYQRNVGNYTNSIIEAFDKMGIDAQKNITNVVTGGNQVLNTFVDIATQSGGVVIALRSIGVAMGNLVKQMLAFIMTPVGATLAVLAAGFYAVRTAIEKDEEASRKWRQSMAPLNAGLQVLQNHLVKVGNAILDMLTPIMSIIGKIGALQDAFRKVTGGIDLITFASTAAFQAIGAMADAINKGLEIGMKWAEKIPVIGKYIAENNKRLEENNRIVEQKIGFEERERKLMVEQSRVEREVSDLRAKVAQKDVYSAKEREKMLREAIALERKLAEDRRKLAEDKFALLKQESALASNTKEDNDALAQAEAEVNREITNYNNKLRELNAQLAEFDAQQKAQATQADALAKQRQAELEQRQKEEAQKLKAQKDTERDIWREYEDALLGLIKNNYEQQRQQVETQYQREIDDLKRRLAEEEDLTDSAREGINLLIIAKQQQLNDALVAIDKARTDEQIQREAERIQLQQDADRLSLEARMSNLQEGTMQMLNLQREQADQEFSFRQANIDREYQQEQERINALAISEQEKNDMLLNLQMDYGNKSKENEMKLANEKKKIAQAEAQMKVEAFNSVKSGIDAMAQHSKAFAVMSKAIALGEIAVNTGKALAAGIAQAQSVPFPANLVAIATTVGTILSNVASAIATVKSAKFAKGGRVDTHQYASGGDVRGAGTGTSDSIHAMLSNGESVMTAAATSMYAPVLSAMNQSAGGNPITGGGSAQGEDMLARAVARGLMAMPNPVVSVEEINTTARRVQVLENLASI